MLSLLRFLLNTAESGEEWADGWLAFPRPIMVSQELGIPFSPDHRQRCWWCCCPRDRLQPGRRQQGASLHDSNGKELCDPGETLLGNVRVSNGRDIAHARETVASDSRSTHVEVLVNVFGGSERSIVEMQAVPGGKWIPMQKVVREDPCFARLRILEEETSAARGLKLAEPMKSPHLWRGLLPPGFPRGTQAIAVPMTDLFGRKYEGKRLIRIE